MDKESQIEEMVQLLKCEPYIGVDTEWRPTLTKFHQVSVSIMQLSGVKNGFIVDLLSLKYSDKLDEALC